MVRAVGDKETRAVGVAMRDKTLAFETLKRIIDIRTMEASSISDLSGRRGTYVKKSKIGTGLIPRETKIDQCVFLPRKHDSDKVILVNNDYEEKSGKLIGDDGEATERTGKEKRENEES